MIEPFLKDSGRLTGHAIELAQKVVGRDYPELRRCFDAGALLLVRARREAERRCKGTPIDYATFAIYATGSECNTRRGAKGVINIRITDKNGPVVALRAGRTFARYSPVRRFAQRSSMLPTVAGGPATAILITGCIVISFGPSRRSVFAVTSA